MAPLHLTLSDLEMLNSRSLRFRSLLSRTGGYLGPMLPLNINRKCIYGESTATVKFDPD